MWLGHFLSFTITVKGFARFQDLLCTSRQPYKGRPWADCGGHQYPQQVSLLCGIPQCTAPDLLQETHSGRSGILVWWFSPEVFFFGYQRFDVELQIMWPPACCTQVVVNYHNADLTPRELAMLDFAMAVCRSDTITEQHFQDLEKHGFDREDAWDIAAIAAFFAMSNRLAHLTDMRPNLDFYNMGRVPRNKGNDGGPVRSD